MQKENNLIKKIQELSEQLNIVNQRIDSYISYFEKIKNDTDIKFSISIYSRNNILENKNLFSKQFILNFYGHNIVKSFFVSFENSNIDFHPDRVPFSLFFSLTKILSDIDENIGLENIKEDIKNSMQLYKEIQKAYKDISYLSSDFNTNSTLIISSFKQLVKKQIKDFSKESESIYLSFKRNNKIERLDIILKFHQESNYFQLKIPKLSTIEQIYSEKYTKEIFVFIFFKTIFLDLFFEENKTFFESFNINKKHIKLIDYSQLKDLNSLDVYLTSLISGLSFNPIKNEDIKILAEKIMIEQKIKDF